MIARDLYNITKVGNLHLYDVKFRCFRCNCEFTVALEHAIDDAAKPVNDNETVLLQSDVYRDAIGAFKVSVPCPQCANRCRTELVEEDGVWHCETD